jgi:hypothetical protein
MTTGANEKPKWGTRIAWILIVGAILGIGIVYLGFPERACWSLLGEGVAPIPLPVDCTVTGRPPTGQSLGSFEEERRVRGLNHQSWIACAGTQEWVRAISTDRRWLPSYVPGTYQWRRTVIVLARAPSDSAGPQAIAEICLVPGGDTCGKSADNAMESLRFGSELRIQDGLLGFETRMLKSLPPGSLSLPK